MRAEGYDLLGRAEEAETDYRTAIESDPDVPEILSRFSRFLSRRGRLDAAIESIQKSGKGNATPGNRLLQANLLGERNKAGDREVAVVLLRHELARADAVEAWIRDALVGTLVKLLCSLGKCDEAVRIFDGISSGFLSEAGGLALRAEANWRAGREEQAKNYAIRAFKALGPDIPEGECLRVAEALTYTGSHAEALSLWKRVLNGTSERDLVHAGLRCASELGDDAFILSLCKQVRGNGRHDPYVLELEVITLERYGSHNEAVLLMQEYLRSPEDDSLARTFRVRLSLIGIRLSRPELVETDVSKLPRVEDVPVWLGGAVATILRHGARPEEGVHYAYELVRRHFSDAEARRIYVGIMGIGEEREISFPNPVALISVMYKCPIPQLLDIHGVTAS